MPIWDMLATLCSTSFMESPHMLVAPEAIFSKSHRAPACKSTIRMSLKLVYCWCSLSKIMLNISARCHNLGYLLLCSATDSKVGDLRAYRPDPKAGLFLSKRQHPPQHASLCQKILQAHTIFGILAPKPQGNRFTDTLILKMQGVLAGICQSQNICPSQQDGATLMMLSRCQKIAAVHARRMKHMHVMQGFANLKDAQVKATAIFLRDAQLGGQCKRQSLCISAMRPVKSLSPGPCRAWTDGSARSLWLRQQCEGALEIIWCNCHAASRQAE